MQNYSTVLNQTTWGIHLNFEGYFASPPNPPPWLTQLQQQDWQQRGIVLWDADLHSVTHLYAGYAIELLEHLQDNSIWKTKGLVVGSPAFQLSSSSVNTPSTKIGGDLMLKNQIEPGTDQTQALFKFLSAQESLLKRISVYDKEDAKQALNKVYRLIADYGKKVRERKGTRELIEIREPKVIPTAIPRGSYFTVYRLHRFATPHQNRSGHGSKKTDWKLSICQDWESSLRRENERNSWIGEIRKIDCCHHESLPMREF